jgi:adenine deaminase
MDPHEIVNVCGLEGMKEMMEDAKTTPLRVYPTTPSCVPASPGLENSKFSVKADDIADTMSWDNVAGLGEMMNIFGVINGDPETHAIIAAALKAGRPVTGHFPLQGAEAALNAYAASGISSCHESAVPEEALAKLRLGMYAMIREGSAWDDLPQVIKAITESNCDTRHVILVSDDIHAETILTQGHVDRIVRLAIRCGVKPVTAIQMATINTAEYFGLSNDLGSLTPGRFADINIVSDLASMSVEKVILGGELVAENGRMCLETPGYQYPASLKHSVLISRAILPQDFDVVLPDDLTYRGVKVMEVSDAKSLTSQRIETLPVSEGKVQMDLAADICKVAVFNRHGLNAQCVGFVKGFKLLRGAAASTYAHDAHNLLVVGTNEDDMALAANTLIKCGGGMTAVAGGTVLSLVELPVAGLLSELKAREIADALNNLGQAWVELGSPLTSPFMTMSLLSLAVIPEIRITDKGIVEVASNRLVPLFAE